ncbi:hypothetical protein BIFDEN_01479 [Bifidobacterium dentium ATCC 27678]|nr:hypothetical protein BIFDEN_01479 [Bifidobacterium dentium ATCC 27678]
MYRPFFIESVPSTTRPSDMLQSPVPQGPEAMWIDNRPYGVYHRGIDTPNTTKNVDYQKMYR